MAGERLENAAHLLPLLAALALPRSPYATHSFAIRRLSLPLALLIALGIVAVAAGIEHWMGRILMCKCGTIKLWYGGRGDFGDVAAPH